MDLGRLVTCPIAAIPTGVGGAIIGGLLTGVMNPGIGGRAIQNAAMTWGIAGYAY